MERDENIFAQKWDRIVVQNTSYKLRNRFSAFIFPENAKNMQKIQTS